ncbi:hypothetical protein GQR60_00315 [Labilibaculum sp. A4]|uniref:hypothetical protein n=1 Tax=Labilibaculum euxinus TaxID=2686357 RepID=UPI000F624E48|nr:hypothetical protein [Labilibaculum euxinus]MDQ1769259.1 hypothetical protein [Labilibaculum euxinus]MWN74783.1 hypothetical protein [Labilibaculum euxinus]
MAGKLNDAMSSEVHINSALRHSRRCKQTKGATELAGAIDPFITDLETKSSETKKEKLLHDNSYDDLVFNSGGLDDRIRTISDTAKQYDRENPGRPVHKLLFPNGGYSTILRFPITKKVDAAEEIQERIKSLGEEHVLVAQLPLLSEAISKVRTSIAALQQANTKVRTAVANEEVAQANLRRQYEFNYLDAIKMFGKTFANRLFPKAVSRKKIKEELAVAENPA